MVACNAKWNRETILIEVSKYNTLTEWHRLGGASYNAAKRINLFSECAMLLTPKTNAKLSSEEFKARRRADNQARYKKLKPHIIANVNAYTMLMYNTNPLFKLKHNLRRRTRLAFKAIGLNKPPSTQFLGADWTVVKSYLESKFHSGMTWENQGNWHIDHIIPLFTATDKSQLILLCHYTNLQPLWAADHYAKSVAERQVTIRQGFP